jgi:Domain of unknown function (DUF4412)
MSSPKIAVAAALAFAVAALPVRAEDLTIVSRAKTGNAPEKTTSQYFTKERVRSNMGDQDSIFEYGAGKMTHIDHKKKEYSEFTLAEMEAQMHKAAAEMEKMNAQFQNMPPEIREKMEKMMGGGAGAVTVTKGATRKIAGYEAQQYTIAMGANLKMETWNTTALQFPVPEADLKKFASFAGAMGPMAQSPMFKGVSKLTEEMQKIQGFALATTTEIQMMGRSTITTSEATEVKPGPVPASVFEIPSGYKKVDSPIAKMGGKK